MGDIGSSSTASDRTDKGLARKHNQPDERALLETIMNHVTARGAHPQMRLFE